MLALQRGRRPKLFSHPEFQGVVDRFVDYKLTGGVRTKQQRFSFEDELVRSELWDAALEALQKEFLGKCAFTEVFSEDATLTLYRPREDARDNEGGVHELHYWWLLPDWSNWYLGVIDTHSNRGTTFPVVGERTPPPTQWPARPRKDRGVLLDPCADDPMFHLGFELDGNVVAREHPSPAVRADWDHQPRGEMSISTYGLFLPQLVESRRSAIAVALQRLDDLIDGPRDGAPDRPPSHMNFAFDEPEPRSRDDRVAELVDARQEHAGCVRQVLAGELVRRIVDDQLVSGRAESWGPPHLRRLCDDLVLELAAHCVNDQTFVRHRHGSPLWDRLANELAERFPDVVETDDYQRCFVQRRRAKAAAKKAPRRSPSKTVPKEPPTVWSHARLTYVKIKNFKGISEIELDLTKPVGDDEAETETGAGIAPWTALLGENGSGKSSILQAIAIALSADRLSEVTTTTDGRAPAVEWGNVLRRRRRGEKAFTQGRVVLQFGPTTEIDFRFNKDRSWYHGLARHEEAMPIVHLTVRGYGAIRLFGSEVAPSATPPVASPAGDHRSNVQIANMFDPTVPVVDARRWLLDLGRDLDDDEEADRLFNTAALTISDLLRAADDTLPKNKLLLRRTKNEVWVDGLRLRDLSDGYRAVVSLAADVLAALGTELSDLRNAAGLVLVDELGAHLHPRWRMRITSALRNALPNMQFIVSTHEPLCLRGLRAGEVVRVWRTADRETAAEQIDRSPEKFRVDQLLTSEFFGLDTAIDPDIDQQYQEYYQLLRFKAMIDEGQTIRKKADRETLARLVGSQSLERAVEAKRQAVLVKARPVLGFTRRDQLMYEVIDDYLKDNADPRANRDRRKAALQRVASIWNDVGGRRGLMSNEED